jgi:SynChlorMet cassette protein ScmC
VPGTPSGFRLGLADGRRWLIRPTDDRAAAVLAELGKAMRLGPGDAGRELYVAVSSEVNPSYLSGVDASDAVVCYLSDPTNADLLAMAMERIADSVAQESLVRGGLLLHAALAEYRGSGFVMAGPGGVGKSTASHRLPPPWRSICDDRTLVVRDQAGRWWAHPWPTWSRFFFDGPGGTWPVERAVPLRAIFFLLQSPADALEPLNYTQAAALLLESALNLTLAAASRVPTAIPPTPVGVRAAKALASAMPAYRLKLTLEGRFWELIEPILSIGPADVPDKTTGEEGRATIETTGSRDALRFVYTGPSMNPTFFEPELLDVRPYGREQARAGDIVCLESPNGGETIVRRVVAVEGRGMGSGIQQGRIRTRGDNNPQDDPWLLQAEKILGRVTAAQRGASRRAVLGGWSGLLVRRLALLGRGIRRSAGLLMHRLYGSAAGVGPFDRLLPRSSRPRLVRFDARHRVFLKLLSGSKTVGQCDARRSEWRIRPPFNLFVDEQSLPTPESVTEGFNDG